ERKTKFSIDVEFKISFKESKICHRIQLTDKNGNVIIKIMQAKLWWVHRRRKYREIREKNHEEIRIWS
uniref:hypothetical protein n=1 Tax=Roseburia inulinivorans TaxID=360807 RepID=UPI004024F40B